MHNAVVVKEVEDQSIVESLLKIMNFFMLDNQHSNVLRSDIVTLEWLNYPELLQKLIALISTCADSGSAHNVVILAEITKHAKLLLVGCIKSKVTLLDTLYAIPAFDSFVLEVILKTSNQRIREEMIDGVSHYRQVLLLPLDMSAVHRHRCHAVRVLVPQCLFCRLPSSIQDPKKYFIPLLVSFLPTIGKYKDHSEQFFDGLSVLIKHEALTAQSKDLLSQVIELLRLHPILEVGCHLLCLIPQGERTRQGG